MENHHEKGLIGALLANGSMMANVIEIVSKSMFKDQSFALIFQALVNLFNRGIKSDFILIEDEMRVLDTKLFDEMNGITYAREAFTMVRDSSLAAEYAVKVKEDYMRRRFLGLFAEQMAATADESKDINELIGRVYAGIDAICNEFEGGDQAMSIHDLAVENLERMRHNRVHGLQSKAIPTGISELDKLLGGGLFRQELITLAARPSEGKSMLLLHMMQEMSKQGHYMRIVNHEMSDNDTANRTIGMLSDVNPDALRRGVLTEAEESQVEELIENELTEMKLDIRYMGNARIERIVTETMLACKKGKCHALGVDYLQLIQAPTDKNCTQDEAVGRNINALKALAVKCNIPVIVVSQLNREIDRRGDKMKLPVLSDLRNSGVIEQTSDVVMFVYRPDRIGITEDTDGSSLKGVSKLIVLKNRNGSIGTARFRHNATFTKLWDFAPVQINKTNR